MDRWLTLVNDDLSSAEELSRWASEAGFGLLGLSGGEEAVTLTRRVRDALRPLAAAVADGRRPAIELAALDEVVSSVPGRMRVGLAQVAFAADAPPLVQVPLRLALEAAGYVLEPARRPLKRCARADPPCGRFFVDHSRDGRGRWCSAACGSVERVRRLRTRERPSGDASHDATTAGAAASPPPPTPPEARR